MSLLAHSTCAHWSMQKERRDLDVQRLHEVNEARRIQRETGCTWAQAIRIAAGLPNNIDSVSPMPVD